MARLILEHNSEVIKDHPLGEGSITIGRQSENTIVLDNPEVSSYHARIDKKGSHFILTDLQSTNGTNVNDKNIISKRLSHGDRILIGGFVFLFVGTEKLEVEAEEKKKALNKTVILMPRPQNKELVHEAVEKIEKNETNIPNSDSKKPSINVSLVLFALLILAVGGWFISANRPPPMKRTSASAISDGTVVEAPKTSKRPLLKTRNNGPLDSVTAKKVSVEPVPTSEMRSLETFTPGSEVFVLTPSEEWEPPTSEKREPLKVQNRIRPETEESTESTVAKKVDDADFELEGIVWSSDVQHSFAVINGFIIRVGGTINGMTVTNITRNDVTLQSAEEDSQIVLPLR